MDLDHICNGESQHIAICHHNWLTENVLETFHCLLKAIRDAADEMYATGYQAPVTGLSGRPKYDLLREQLLYFIENSFSSNMISSMLVVSLSTIRRRLSEYGLSIRQMYSQISDRQLRTPGAYRINIS